jgi:hypothetical protein
MVARKVRVAKWYPVHYGATDGNQLDPKEIDMAKEPSTTLSLTERDIYILRRAITHYQQDVVDGDEFHVYDDVDVDMEKLLERLRQARNRLGRQHLKQRAGKEG